MAYNKEDNFVSGLMTGDSEKDEVFGDISTSNENNQTEVPTLNEKAKAIFTKVGNVLSSFENVNAVCKGKAQKGVVVDSGEQMVVDLCDLGYFYPTSRTNYAETKHIFNTEITRFKEQGQIDKANALSSELEKLEEGMLEAAIPVIVEGLQDGSIDPNLTLMSDDEIVKTLINSDNTKEIQIQEAFKPTMVNAYIQEGNILCASNDATPVE